ncbi:Ebp2-domain-containing protein [Pleomassaria siparia CBS 279.74]|uniref:Ebp2-domain-containing protein n=1 Tax=Pleomassaria siparia CBS 279.74 TaxID=1314801 RepID=A0A6G1JZR5_9PLEO|nr:Ebp2-domain-containing protein [Pleomassaria siparia CBS 279.74]
MAKSKLLSALDNEKGRNFKLEKQRKQEKEARKRKAKHISAEDGNDGEEDDGVSLAEEVEAAVNGQAKKEKKKDKKKGLKPAPAPAVEEPEWETDESDEEIDSEDELDDDDDIPDRAALDLSRLEDSDSEGMFDSDEEEEGEEDDDEEEDPEAEDDIPLSDIESLASEDKGDIIPHQRLTINNTAALTAALNRISLPYSKLAFSEYQSITTDEPVDIPDVEDDLNRELAFYKQSLSAVKEARQQLKKEGVPWSRPVDYFAEMVKSDEHMGKIKAKLVDDAAGKKASAEARKQRDLKKFGKQVQVAKLQERAKEKRDTLEKISLLKRKRQGADVTTTNEEDLFDVELDKAEKPTKDQRGPKPKSAGASSGGTGRRSSMGGSGKRKASSGDRDGGDDDGKPNFKRQKKDSKYGFGGKKRHAKSNDAISSADGRGFSAKKMKAGGAHKRLGKDRRAKRN